MNDRELLERAAKAAGLSFHVSRESHDKGSILVNDSHWNPLEDDAQALLLAVKLKIIVEPGDEYTYAMCPAAFDFCAEEGPHTAEQAAEAARRAIVRAAAEMVDA